MRTSHPREHCDGLEPGRPGFEPWRGFFLAVPSGAGQSLNLLETWFLHLSREPTPTSLQAVVRVRGCVCTTPGPGSGKCSEHSNGLLSFPLSRPSLPFCVMGSARWGSSVGYVGNPSWSGHDPSSLNSQVCWGSGAPTLSGLFPSLLRFPHEWVLRSREETRS